LKRLTLLVPISLSLAFMSGSAGIAQSPEEAALVQARRARDLADVKALRAAIESGRNQVSQTRSFENYLRLALLEAWTCEAAHGLVDKQLLKEAAKAGVDAAEQAVKLNPNSSEAHRLLGDLLGELIPHVFAGGMRYGPRSTKEIEKAIELDPRNANAFVARATNYFFTPGMFGGSKQKAVEMLEKAIELDRLSDAAVTAHIWLALVYADVGQWDNAQREIDEARKLKPDRVFGKFVYSRILSHKGKSN